MKETATRMVRMYESDYQFYKKIADEKRTSIAEIIHRKRTKSL